MYYRVRAHEYNITQVVIGFPPSLEKLAFCRASSGRSSTLSDAMVRYGILIFANSPTSHLSLSPIRRPLSPSPFAHTRRPTTAPSSQFRVPSRPVVQCFPINFIRNRANRRTVFPTPLRPSRTPLFATLGRNVIARFHVRKNFTKH